MFPNIKLHSLGPPEIAHIAQLGGYTHTYVLEELMKSGLDSLPGAGAEILVDRVRKIISTGKCLSDEWLDVMRAAHQLHLTTSGTMMFGHIETIEERFYIWRRSDRYRVKSRKMRRVSSHSYRGPSRMSIPH